MTEFVSLGSQQVVNGRNHDPCVIRESQTGLSGTSDCPIRFGFIPRRSNTCWNFFFSAMSWIAAASESQTSILTTTLSV